jgi:hypothetical protein
MTHASGPTIAVGHFLARFDDPRAHIELLMERITATAPSESRSNPQIAVALAIKVVKVVKRI